MGLLLAFLLLFLLTYRGRLTVRQKDLITLVLALSIAFLAALISKALFEKQEASTKKAPPITEVHHESHTAEVLVATQNISIGESIKSSMITWQKWPKEAVLDTYIVRNNETSDQYQKLLNGLSKRQISHGEPITLDDIIKAGDRSFLAAIVAPGMRAVSLPLGSSAAGSSLLSPGDRVDIISANIFRSSFKQDNNFSGTTLVENAKVLAVDRHLGSHRTSETKGGIQIAQEESAKFITIEVTPEEAEILSMATKLGELTFSLRGMEKTPQKNRSESIQSLKKRLQEQLGQKDKEKDKEGSPLGGIPLGYKVQTVIHRGTEASPVNFLQKTHDGEETWTLVVDNKGGSLPGMSMPNISSSQGMPLLGKEKSDPKQGIAFGPDPAQNTAKVQELIAQLKATQNPGSSNS